MTFAQATHIREELESHIPYSVGSTVAGMLVLGSLSFIVRWFGSGEAMAGVSAVLFHFFHPGHVFFSAATTTAMFWRHERNVIKLLGIVVLGGVIPCVLSDVLIPYLGGRLVGVAMDFHFDFELHPFWMLFVVFLGMGSGAFITGRLEHSTIFSHSLHVFISTMATLFYLVSYGFSDWSNYLLALAFIGILSVIVPCCLGDIVIPHLFTTEGHRH